MSKKKTRNTKGKIISAAWELFYEQGYDDTTVEEIIEKSGTSKGSFYHYFEGKDALLGSLSIIFDEKYQELMETIDVTKGEKHLLDHNRLYFKVLRKIVTEGQKNGELTDELSVNEIVRAYAMLERAFLYDWCIRNGDYSLLQYSEKMFPVLFGGYKKM